MTRKKVPKRTMIQLALDFENVKPVTACAVEGSVEISRHRIKYFVPREFVDSKGVRYICIGIASSSKAYYIGSNGHTWHYDPERGTLKRGFEKTNYSPARDLSNKHRDYIKVNYKGKERYAHRLVAQFFLNDGEPIPPGMQVDHLDGDTLNNDVSNLEIITPEENYRRRNKKYGYKHMNAHTRNLKAEAYHRRIARLREEVRGE